MKKCAYCGKKILFGVICAACQLKIAVGLDKDNQTPKKGGAK